MHHAVLVGDTPYDEAPRTAKAHSVGVLTGHFSEPVLHEAGCEAVFRNVVHLGRTLEAFANDAERLAAVRDLVSR